ISLWGSGSSIPVPSDNRYVAFNPDCSWGYLAFHFNPHGYQTEWNTYDADSGSFGPSRSSCCWDADIMVDWGGSGEYRKGGSVGPGRYHAYNPSQGPYYDTGEAVILSDNLYDKQIADLDNQITQAYIDLA